MDCNHHPDREAEFECSHCGKLLCRSCAKYFLTSDETEIVCLECRKKELQDEIASIPKVKQRIKSEIRGIIILMVIGLILGLVYGIPYVYENYGENALGLMITAPILISFSTGSIIPAFKILKRMWEKIISYLEDTLVSDDNKLVVFVLGFFAIWFVFLGYCITSPLITIYRIIIRKIDVKRLDEIDQQSRIVLENFSDYENQTTIFLNYRAGSLASDDDDSEEFIVDKSNKYDFDVRENGEIIRKIYNR